MLINLILILIQTKWNSTYYIIDRLLQQQEPVCAVLIEVKKAAKIIVIKTLMKFLQPMVQITGAIGGEKLAIVSAVRPYCINFSHCTWLKVLQIQHLLNYKETLDGKPYSGVMNLIKTVCLLDPRFKALAFLAENDKKNVIKP